MTELVATAAAVTATTFTVVVTMVVIVAVTTTAAVVAVIVVMVVTVRTVNVAMSQLFLNSLTPIIFVFVVIFSARLSMVKVINI